MGTKGTWNGVEHEILLDSRQGISSIGSFISTTNPGGGPPRHIHHDADESFFILSGEVEFWIAGETIFAHAGDMLTVPQGVEHAYRVIGENPARKLSIYTPGGFENFFTEMANLNLRIPQDMQRIIEIGERYNLTFTGPPLGAAA